MARYGWALAASAAAAFFVTRSVPTIRPIACDAIAINWAVPVVVAGVLMQPRRRQEGHMSEIEVNGASWSRP